MIITGFEQLLFNVDWAPATWEAAWERRNWKQSFPSGILIGVSSQLENLKKFQVALYADMDIKKGALGNIVFGDQGKGNVRFGAKQTDRRTNETEFESCLPSISGIVGKSFYFSQPQFIHL